MCFVCDMRSRAEEGGQVGSWITREMRLREMVAAFQDAGGHLPTVGRDLLRSAAARDDWRQVKIYLDDWRQSPKRVANVSKWSPGDHYYALNEKFSTLAAAKKHLAAQGYEFGELKVRYVYARGGD